MSKVKTHTLLSVKTDTGAGDVIEPIASKRTFQLTGFTSAGAGTADVDVEVSNDGINFKSIDTLSLTLGTTVTSDLFTSDAPWKHVRGNVTTISGTDAEVTLTLGNESS